jgi:hypothetical protein
MFAFQNKLVQVKSLEQKPLMSYHSYPIQLAQLVQQQQ